MSCWMPLGCDPCQCDEGDGTTKFIRRLDVAWADATLTYTFEDATTELISDPHSVGMCMNQILKVYIPLAEEKGDDAVMEFWVDGKKVGLAGAKALVELRRLHSKVYHAK